MNPAPTQTPKKSTLLPSQLLEHLDLPSLRAAAAHLSEAGHSPEDIAREIVAMIDAAVPWEVIFPGVVGVALEAIDGPVVTFLATSIVRAIAAMKNVKKKHPACERPSAWHPGYAPAPVPVPASAPVPAPAPVPVPVPKPVIQPT